MSPIPAVIVIAAGLFPLSSSGAAIEPSMYYWNQFRGHDSRGVAFFDDCTLPSKFGPELNVKWMTKVISGVSSPTMGEIALVLTGYDRASKKLETFSIHPETGKLRWQRTVPAEKIERVHRVNSPASATPACRILRRTSVVYFGSYGLICHDSDGNELWKKPLSVPETRFGTGTSPIVSGNQVFLCLSGNPSSLLCLDVATGETVWKKEQLRMGAGYAVPIVRRTEQLTKEYVGASQEMEVKLRLLERPRFVYEIIVFGERGITAYDSSDGSERWWVGGIIASAIPTPVFNDDGSMLYIVSQIPGGDPDDPIKLPAFDDLLKQHDANKDGVLSMDEVPKKLVIYSRGTKDSTGDITLGNLIAHIDLNRDGKITRLEWFAANTLMKTLMHNYLIAIRPGGKGEVSRTHVVWKEKMSLPEVPSPLFYRDNIYLVRNGGLLTCVDAKTGKIRYTERLGASGQYYASPVAGDGKIYLASADGVVTVVKAGNKFEKLASNDLGETIMATPAIHAGTIYVRTDEHLYAFRLKDK